MTSVTRARMFEPFYSTKAPGSGTGLGLSMVHGVVHQSGGTIHVTSEPGIGTTVAIYLPRSQDGAVASEVVATAASMRGGETILLVEDAALVRALVKDVLTESGYRVLEAADGKEGLAVFDSNTGRIDLLLTDLAMPGMNGQQLASAIRERQPGIKILFMSAYPPESAQLPGVPPENFLQKPFNPDDLHRLIRRALDG
jgi:CheY-like chemotaxis protein